MTEKGNYRSVYSTFPESDRFKILSKDGRWLITILKICRFNNPANIFYCDEGEFVTLSDITKIPISKIKKLITGELSDSHWIAFERPILWLRKGLKYEPGIKLSNANHKVCVEKIIESLPKRQIVLNFCDYYNLAKPFDSPSIAPPNNDTDTDTERENETERDNEEPPQQKVVKWEETKNERFLEAWEDFNGSDYEAKGLSIATEFTKAKNWVANNPYKKDYKRFITNWLNTELTRRNDNESKPKRNY